MRIRAWLRRLDALARRGRSDDRLREEIDAHIEMRRQQLIDEGMDPREALYVARRAFGNVAAVREEARNMWGFPSIDGVVQDVRYGVRLLRRAPWFTAVAVLSLAVGLGSAASVFAIADGVLLRPLDVRAPRELREFRAKANLGGSHKDMACVPSDAFERLQSGAVAFADVIGFRQAGDASLGAAGMSPHRLRVEMVSDRYFEVLGVPPAAGRLLSPSEPGTGPVPIVISERLWRAAFEGDAAVAGRPVTVNGTPAVVMGVARRFRGLTADSPADVFVPAAATIQFDPPPACAGLRVVVRMHPGQPLTSAADRMAPLFKGNGPSLLGRADVRIALNDASRGVSDVRASLERPVLIGLVLVGVLVLVACANTGGLLAARFAARRTEFGLRLAIGAATRRVMQQLIVEALLLGVLAGTAALLVAPWAAPVLLAWMPFGEAPPDFELRTDWRVVIFTGVLAAVAAFLSALASLFRLLRSDLHGIHALNTRSVTAGRRRAARALVAAQVACSLLLLVAAGAMARTLINLHRVDPGFDPAGVLAVTVDAAGRTADPSALPGYYSRLIERVAAAPGVARASFAQFGLMTRPATNTTVDIPGWSPASDADRWSQLYWVGPDYIETFGMRMIAGQSIGTRESAGKERVTVVNHEFARFYFGSPANAVGRTVNRTIRIIGVVADARYHTLRDGPARAMFVPHTQAPPRPQMTLVIRPDGDLTGAANTVMAAVKEFDPRLSAKATPLADVIAVTLARERFVTRLAAILSALAVLLSCAGLYAAVAYAVSERRHELAVRLALGASAGDIVRLVAGDPLRTTLAGIAIATPGVYAVMRGLSNLLFGLPPFDVITLLVCAAGLIVVALVAAWWPARRATRIDPMVALRAE